MKLLLVAAIVLVAGCSAARPSATPTAAPSQFFTDLAARPILNTALGRSLCGPASRVDDQSWGTDGGTIHEKIGCQRSPIDIAELERDVSGELGERLRGAGVTFFPEGSGDWVYRAGTATGFVHVWVLANGSDGAWVTLDVQETTQPRETTQP